MKLKELAYSVGLKLRSPMVGSLRFPPSLLFLRLLRKEEGNLSEPTVTSVTTHESDDQSRFSEGERGLEADCVYL